MQSLTKHGIYFDVYNDVNELVNRWPTNINNRQKAENHFQPHNIYKSWAGTDSVEELNDICEYGWAHGLRKAEKVLASVKAPSLPSPKRKRKWAMGGMRLDPIKVNNGSIRPFQAMHKVGTDKWNKKGVVTIVVNIVTTANYSSGQYLWRGATAIRLAEMLIKSGRRVRIIAVDPSRIPTDRGQERYTAVVEVKRFSDPLSKAKVFTALSFSGFYRTHFFKSCYCMEDRQVNGVGGPDHGFDVDRHLDWYLDDTPHIYIADIYSNDSANILLEQTVEQIEKQRKAMA